MRLSYVPFTLVIRLINCWDFMQIWYDNKMLSSQWDNDNQHFVYIIVSWYLLGIITRQGFLFSCSCMIRCTCCSIVTLTKFSISQGPCALVACSKTFVVIMWLPGFALQPGHQPLCDHQIKSILVCSQLLFKPAASQVVHLQMLMYKRVGKSSFRQGSEKSNVNPRLSDAYVRR